MGVTNKIRENKQSIAFSKFPFIICNIIQTITKILKMEYTKKVLFLLSLYACFINGFILFNFTLHHQYFQLFFKYIMNQYILQLK